MSKRALIMGITGQGASYLSEILADDGVEVFGLARRSGSPNFSRIEHIKNKVKIIYGDLTDSKSMVNAVFKTSPDYVFNLAANSFVPNSWENPESVLDINTLGVCRLLNAVELYRRETGNNIRVCQASSSEMFGRVRETPQNENTPFYPRSPYGVSKAASHYLAINYRESYNMHVSCSIMFNYESFRRGNEFVTKKIVREASRIKDELMWSDEPKPLLLGNLDAKRDWSHCKDTMRACYLMVQQDVPDDYVIASGETHSVREFVELAFKRLAMKLLWNKEKTKASMSEMNDGNDKFYPDVVQVSSKYYRPADVELLLGDPSKAKEKLGWQPEYSFEDLVNEMVDCEYYGVNKGIKKKEVSNA